MSRTFAYTRISTFDQTPKNQVQEIKAAGFAVEPHRIITETLSGSMAIAQRQGFSKLLDRMEKGDVLQNGETVSAIAREFQTSRQTIMRVKN